MIDHGVHGVLQLENFAADIDGQRAIVIEALGILPNVRQVYLRLGKRIGVSYGTIWNIARAEGIELVRFRRRK